MKERIALLAFILLLLLGVAFMVRPVMEEESDGRASRLANDVQELSDRLGRNDFTDDELLIIMLSVQRPLFKEGDYAILKNTGEPVRIVDLDLVDPDNGTMFPFWLVEYELPTDTFDPLVPRKNDAAVREDELEESSGTLAEDLFWAIVKQAQMRWSAKHPNGLVALNAGSLYVRNITFDDNAKPRNLIEYRVEQPPTYASGHRLVSTWLSHWTDAETGQIVYAPNKHDRILNVLEVPDNTPPENSMFQSGEIGNIFMMGNMMMSDGTTDSAMTLKSHPNESEMQQ